MSIPIQEQKMLWHLTPLENLEGIISKGLLSRDLLTVLMILLMMK
jgi:hypothetical protein